MKGRSRITKHGRDHRPPGTLGPDDPGGHDPVMVTLPSFEWEDITSDLAVSRVTGGDSDPDISNVATTALLFEIGGTAGLKVVKLKIQLGSGGPGSGTSPYLISGLGVESLDNLYAGRGYIRKTSTSNQPIYGCQLIGLGTGNLGVLWDGSTTGVTMGPAASTGGAPFDFAAGDTIFNGIAIFG